MCLSSSSSCVVRGRHPQCALVSEGALGRPASYTVLLLPETKEQGCRNKFVPSSEVGLRAPFLLNSFMGTVGQSLVCVRVGNALHHLESR